MRSLTIFLFLQLVIGRLNSQTDKHFNFIHYPAESGIISYQVNTTVQDERGYMWLGTTNGLQRFDGIRFKTFRHETSNPQSLPSNPVWQLLVDRKNNLWVLLADGKVGIFDTRNFTFKEVPASFKEPVSPNTALKRLITDEAGNLFYLIAGSEVITFNENAGSFSYKNNFFKQKDDWHITGFVQQPGTGKYWLAIENGGLAVYNKISGTLSYPDSNAGKELAVAAFDRSKTFSNLFFDNQNRLWAAHFDQRPKIYCFNTTTGSFLLQNHAPYPQDDPYFEIKQFIQQKDGTIWVNGLFLMARFVEKENRFQLVHNGYLGEHSISYEMVHCLFEDRENNVWVCTDNNGLYRFNPSREFFSNIDHTNPVTGKKGDGSILSFVQTRDSSLLVGTWNDGLYRYDRNFNPLPVNIKGLDDRRGPFIWNIAASGDGNTLWLAAQPGFYAVDQLNSKSTYFNPPVLENNTIRQINEDKKGNLWLGTQHKGLFKCTVSRQPKISVDRLTAMTAVPAVQINKITVDLKGQVWVGTPENGLYVLDPATGDLLIHFGEQEENEKKLPERGISSILQFNDSLMLITTATRLVKYNTITKSTELVGNPGFISGFITAVEKDRKGNAWLTSTSGLYRIDISSGVNIVYDRTDGLDNEHFIQSASYTLPDGGILFGTTHNFISFTPGKLDAQPAKTTAKITGIKLGNKPLNTDSVASLKELTLGYDDNTLVIEFSPFSYSGINIVYYRIDGLDKDWNHADRTNQAVYNYLPPGTYDFMIQSADESGNRTGAVTTLKIRVKSPFWKTWWFYSLLLLLGFGILYWFDRERMARKEAVQQMRSEIADDLHEEVTTALGNINILSELARMKADTEPQKSKEFIEQINTNSHNMIIAMDDMLWSISPENDSMEKTILRLKEFIDELKNQHEVQIDLLVDESVKLLQLDMKQRKDLFWFFKGGISSVTRTGGENCLIHIMYEKPNLIYTLEFDSTNTDIQHLNNLRRRKELADKLQKLNARLEVQELTSKTIFQLLIPVNR